MPRQSDLNSTERRDRFLISGHPCSRLALMLARSDDRPELAQLLDGLNTAKANAARSLVDASPKYLLLFWGCTQ